MRRYITIFFLLVGSALNAQLPQYHARIFDARNGLSANTITDIFKDKEDLLWIIYNYSSTVERFDGRSVEKFTFSETIIHYLNDDKNNTWMIGTNTVNRLRERAARFQTIPFDTSDNNKLVRIFQLPGKPVTLLSSKCFYEWDEEQQTFVPAKKPFVTPGRRNIPTHFDTCGNTLFFPGRQLYAYDYKNDKIDSLPASSLFSVYAFTPTLAIFVRFDGQAFWADFANKKTTLLDASKYFPGEKMVHFRVTGVEQLSNGKFLVLTSVGLMEYDLSTDRFQRLGVYAEGTPFEYENVLSRLIIDKDGVAWAHAETIITSLSPISKTLGLIRNKEQEAARKWSNFITSFAEDGHNRLWVGSGFGFMRLNYHTGFTEVFHPVENAPDRLNHESIRGILFDGKYVILGPSDKGIWLFDPNTKKYKRPHYANDSTKRLSENDFFDMIYTLRNGDHIFPGRDALYVMNGESYELRTITMPSRFNSNVAFNDSEGRIWIGTMSSLFCLDENYNFQFKIKTTLGSTFCIFETSPGHYLIGNSHGLYRMKYNGAETTAEPIPTPMGNTPIVNLFRDKLNHYWFSTTNGLYLSDAEFTAFRKFDYTDNVQSLLFGGNSFIQTKQGLVFLGGKHGINYFYPEHFSIQDKPLNVFVKSAIINAIDTLTAEELQNKKFGFHQKRLMLQLVTPYYNNTEKLHYRYKLIGLAEEWIYNGNNNIINFGSLPPGKYELIVAVSTNGKHWFEGRDVYSFSIRPPLWKKPWFIALCILALMGILFLLQNRREKYIRHKEETKLLQEKLKAENLQFRLEANQAQLSILENERKAATAKLQSMRLQMNPHFLFNALNSIQQMIMTGKEEKATLYLSKFSKLLRMVLTHSDREVVSLREETEMLKLYIELEALRFEDSFVYKVDIENGVDADDNKVPTLLIQPFVENAIWHGLLHKEGLRKLDVRFTTNENEDLVCTVEDNGIGREAAHAFTKKSSQNGGHTGKGVSVADERLRIFNQQNGDSSKLNITDVVDESGKIAGTRVTITLPNLA